MINRVEMINWRAYEHHEVSFGPGITFIMGANGKGKTSILEAIAYALTGETATVEKRGKLLRDPEKLATVRVQFTIDGQEYSVERSQSNKRAESAKLIKAGLKKPLASNHKSVTSKIEEIMGVSAEFLQRIIYMSEGNVFRFLKESSGKALNIQIRQVLGLTQVDEFMKVLNQAEKEIRDQMGEVRKVLMELKNLGIGRGTNLDQSLQERSMQREELLTRLRSTESKIAQLRREEEDIQHLTQILSDAVPTLQQDTSRWSQIQNIPVISVFSQLEEQLQETRAAIQQQQVIGARLEGERSGYQRILDILLPYAEQRGTFPCPVCGKPMTKDEYKLAVQEIQNNKQRLDQELQHLRRNQSEAETSQNRLSRQVAILREVRNNLTHVSFKSISPRATMNELVVMTRPEQAYKFQENLRSWQQQIIELEKQLNRLETERANYLAIQSRLQNLGYESPEEASTTLVGLEIRYLSLRAASQAAQETLTAQRNVDMETIYSQLARVWGAFIGDQTWRIELDWQGMPTLEDQAGRQFDLSQFSGGEKTALLVMLHTIIAHHFAKSDFLLIDEPLEHLDPVNRRSLIRFLVGAYQRGNFKQAIIATFEESLIRKYMSDEGVNIIHL